MNVSKGEFPTVTDVLTTMGTIAYCPYVKAANTQIVRICLLFLPRSHCSSLQALLDPQWLTNAFVLLLQTKNSVAREGVISADDLQVTWALYPVEIHSFLIALFRVRPLRSSFVLRFDCICYYFGCLLLPPLLTSTSSHSNTNSSSCSQTAVCWCL